MPLLQTSERGGIFSLCLDNPPAHALSRRLVTEMQSALSSLEKAEPRALILTASGDRFFSAGLDLIESFPYASARITAQRVIGWIAPAAQAGGGRRWTTREKGDQGKNRIRNIDFPIVVGIKGVLALDHWREAGKEVKEREDRV